MASHDGREEQLGYKWEIDVACVGFDGNPLPLAGVVVHYQLSRRGQVKLLLNSTTNADRFQVVSAEDGQLIVTVRPADQTALTGGLVYEEKVWTVGADSLPVDQAAGNVHVRL